MQYSYLRRRGLRPFDSNGTFRPAAVESGVRRVAIRGAGVTVAGQGLAFGLQMIATVILARLVTPGDFGVVTMCTTISLLFMNFGGNGFTEVLVQRQEIDHSLVSNVFWVNFIAGLALTIAFAASGSLLARFYGDERVARVAAGISLTILFTSASVPHLALLKRAMWFPLISMNDIISRFVAVVVSIVLAWAGWKYWALVAGAVALPLSTCIGAWALCQWIPGLPRRNHATVPVVRSAMNVYGSFALNYFSRNMDNVLVGSLFGSGPLGFYKKAYDIFILPANQLLFPASSVALATLSRVADDGEAYRRYLLRTLSIFAFVGMGLGACIMLIGRDLTFVLLGPKWEETGRILLLFAPGIGATLISPMSTWIHFSLGRTDRCFRWGIVEFVVVASLFLAALPWGPMGIALAWTASTWVLAIPAIWYAGRPAQLRATALVEVVWRYVLGAALAGIASIAIIGSNSFVILPPSWQGCVLRIVTFSSLFAFLYIGVVILLHRGYEPIRQIVTLLPEFLRWRGHLKSSVSVTDKTPQHLESQ